MSDAYNAAVAALDPGSISSLTSQEATAKLAELTAAYRGEQPIAEVLKQQPKNAVEAHRKLAALQGSKEWRDLYFGGNAAAARDFQELTAMIANGSEADFAVAGIVPEHHYNTGPGAGLQDQISAANDMRARGLSVAGVNEWLAREGIDPATMSNEKAIHSILSDVKPSPATHEAAKAEHARLMSDKDFWEAFNMGDPWARTHFTIVCWGKGCV